MGPRLELGSRGPFVTELKRLLNFKLRPSPNLPINDNFDQATRSAVIRFQRAHWLQADGIVGACSWAALKDMERYAVSHPVRLVPQPTRDTCWAAATAMLLGQHSPVSAPPGMSTRGGIANDSDLASPRNTEIYNRHFGLTMLPGQSWMPDGIAALMRVHGPLLVNTLWNSHGYTTPDPASPGQYVGSSGHYRVFSGIRGDGTIEGTTLRIHDPWPPRHGKIESVTYGTLMRRYPTTTYQISYR